MFSHHLKLRKQRGFTLIELVIVIVIIGILAAIALPKFASLSADARAGTIKGVRGAMASANVAIFSASNAQNKGNGSTAADVNVCGTTVNATFGYATNIAALRKCLDLNPTGDFTTSGAVQPIASQKATCQVDYTAPTSATVQPLYPIDVADCS